MAGRKLLEIVEGWTQELEPFRLWSDGSPVNLTGLTVDLIVKDKGDTDVPIARANVRVDSDQTWNAVTETGGRGQIYLTPVAGQFVNASSPYSIRAKVTDGSGKVAYWPNGAPDSIVVFKP